MVGEEARSYFSEFYRPPNLGAQAGRPVKTEVTLNFDFEQVCDFMENEDDSQFMLQDLFSMMGTDSYTGKHFVKRLTDKYGNYIVVASSEEISLSVFNVTSTQPEVLQAAGEKCLLSIYSANDK